MRVSSIDRPRGRSAGPRRRAPSLRHNARVMPAGRRKRRRGAPLLVRRHARLARRRRPPPSCSARAATRPATAPRRIRAVPAAAFARSLGRRRLAAMYRELTPRARRENPRTYHRFDDAYARRRAHREPAPGARPAGRLHVRRPRTRRCPVAVGTSRVRRVPGHADGAARARRPDLPVAWTPCTDVPRADRRRDAPRRVTGTGRAAARSWPATAAVARRSARAATARYPAGTPFALITGLRPRRRRARPICRRGGSSGGQPDAGVRPGGPGGVARPDPRRPARACGWWRPARPTAGSRRPDPGPKPGQAPAERR